ncbi:MAG: hypothetical protein KJ077_35175 [Anaerolineae bacterium]|nr:hypothetical protein [Anaerolineae bacterium]
MENVAVKDVVDALFKLPSEQIATVYEFILFLQARHGQTVDVAGEWSDEDVNDLIAATLHYASETVLADEADND